MLSANNQHQSVQLAIWPLTRAYVAHAQAVIYTVRIGYAHALVGPAHKIEKYKNTLTTMDNQFPIVLLTNEHTIKLVVCVAKRITYRKLQTNSP